MAYALWPTPYALCPMPYARLSSVHRTVTEKGYNCFRKNIRRGCPKSQLLQCPSTCSKR
jgi:hypothetical protein